MKIIKFQAENFKRLKAVSITPKGDVVEISGKNGAGKSSILDSIWATLGGAENVPAIPVRIGAEKAVITLDLGDYIVKRTFHAKEGNPTYTSSLIVENKEGLRSKSPQTLLNELTGRFCLDPMAFVNMSPKAQFDALKYFVPNLDLDDIKAKDEHDRELRTVENRKAKENQAAAAALGAKDGNLARIDTEKVTADIARASEHNSGIQQRQQRRKDAETQVMTFKKQAIDTKARVEVLQAEIDALKEQGINAVIGADDLEKKLAAAEALPSLLDTAKLVQELANANSVNAEANKQARRDEYISAASKHDLTSKALTEAIEARDAHKRQTIANAKFPVQGLSLGDERVLVDGVPFDQAATSQKIRTAMAIAMASKPEIRVIRIEDGSLLDKDSLKLVADMAKENDFQIWLESVNDGAGSGIVIEDGMLKE